MNLQNKLKRKRRKISPSVSLGRIWPSPVSFPRPLPFPCWAGGPSPPALPLSLTHRPKGPICQLLPPPAAGPTRQRWRPFLPQCFERAGRCRRHPDPPTAIAAQPRDQANRGPSPPLSASEHPARTKPIPVIPFLRPLDADVCPPLPADEAPCGPSNPASQASPRDRATPWTKPPPLDPSARSRRTTPSRCTESVPP